MSGAHGVYGFDTVVLEAADGRVDTLGRWRKAQAVGQRVIVDVDDHFDMLDPANRAYAATSPANPVRNRDHYRRSILAADTVVVSTRPCWTTTPKSTPTFAWSGTGSTARTSTSGRGPRAGPSSDGSAPWTGAPATSRP